LPEAQHHFMNRLGDLAVLLAQVVELEVEVD
jgi:hypothetical protein